MPVTEKSISEVISLPLKMDASKTVSRAKNYLLIAEALQIDVTNFSSPLEFLTAIVKRVYGDHERVLAVPLSKSNIVPPDEIIDKIYESKLLPDMQYNTIDFLLRDILFVVQGLRS